MWSRTCVLIVQIVRSEGKQKSKSPQKPIQCDSSWTGWTGYNIPGNNLRKIKRATLSVRVPFRARSGLKLFWPPLMSLKIKLFYHFTRIRMFPAETSNQNHTKNLGVFSFSSLKGKTTCKVMSWYILTPRTSALFVDEREQAIVCCRAHRSLTAERGFGANIRYLWRPFSRGEISRVEKRVHGRRENAQNSVFVRAGINDNNMLG